MKLAPFTFILLYFSYGQKPDWLNPVNRLANYPTEQYVQGFASRSYSSVENLSDIENEVLAQARVRLSESVLISIKSVSQSDLSNVNEETTDVYHKRSVTKTELVTAGLQSETYVDKKRKVIYGFVYVSKQQLQRNYYRTFRDLMTLIRDDLQAINKAYSYQELVHLLSKVNEATSIQRLLPYLGLRGELVLMERDLVNARREIDSKMSRLKTSSDVDFSSASSILSEELINEVGEELQRPVKVNGFTFQDTGIATEFTGLFNTYLLKELKSNFDIVSNKNEWVLNGSYWPIGNKVMLNTTLHESEGGELTRLIAVASIEVPMNYILSADVSYLPLKSNSELDRYNEIITSESWNEITLELRTQKGNEALIFREGEVMELSVSVARPAYLRIVNVWADGTQLLLLNNYYLDEGKVNNYIDLPFSWETSCPCGTEYIYAIASSMPNPNLEVRSEDGFDYLVDPINVTLEKQRGFRRKPVEYVGETSIIVTTLPNER